MKIKTIKDYYQQIQEKFPEISLSDIKKILNFGFKSLYLHNVYGGDVYISDNDLWMYIGNLTNDSLKHFENYKKKLALKIRVLNKRNKRPWDGYYYFGLLDKQQLQINQQMNKKGRKRKHFEYGNVVLYRLLEECKIIESDKKYIYRVPILYSSRYSMYIENFKTDKAELIITRRPWTFNDILNNK